MSYIVARYNGGKQYLYYMDDSTDNQCGNPCWGPKEGAAHQFQSEGAAEAVVFMLGLQWWSADIEEVP